MATNGEASENLGNKLQTTRDKCIILSEFAQGREREAACALSFIFGPKKMKCDKCSLPESAELTRLVSSNLGSHNARFECIATCSMCKANRDHTVLISY